MGDNNSATGDGDEVTPLSVSAFFDQTFREYLNLTRGDETSSEVSQAKIKPLIKKLEDLTRQVSVLGILSDNENYKEMNPSELKFILLPFMIGNLWQLCTVQTEPREHVCMLSKVYFKDYLKRCFNYEVIEKLPTVASTKDEDEEAEKEVAGDEKTPIQRAPPAMNSDDVRLKKIQAFKEKKKLEDSITQYLDGYMKAESLDDEDLQTFVVSFLRRSAFDAEDQLHCINTEMELINFASKMKLKNSAPSASSSSSHSHPHNCSRYDTKDAKKKPPQVFILTKSQMEKQVFGAGYPAIPVMTVEELYEQRIKTGQWGPHPSANQLPAANETEDDREAQQEALQDQDDPELRERQRRMDEFKDEHRAGYGNRYNRS